MLSLTMACVLAASMPVPDAGWSVDPDSAVLNPAGSYPFSCGYDVKLDTARGLAFVSSGGGVFVVDVSDPGNPVVLSDRIRTAGNLHNIWFDGDRLYLAVFSDAPSADIGSEIQIWDVSQPASPQVLGGVNLSYPAIAVWARDSLMLVTTYRHFFSYDVADAADPVRLDSLLTGDQGTMMAVRDSLAFVANMWSGVTVVSISDPAELAILARWGESGLWAGLDIRDNRLYQVSTAYGGSSCGLRIYDIVDPLHGQLLGVYDTAGSSTYRVVVDDTIASVMHRQSAEGFRLLSVADPRQPYELSRYGTTACGVVLHRGLAYVAFRARFEVVDVSDPRNPSRLGTAATTPTGTDVALSGGVLCGLGGQFCVLDPSGPDLELRGVLALPYSPTVVAASDTLAAVVTWSSPDTVRLHVIGVSDPDHPDILATISPGSWTPGLVVVLRETLGYLASDSGLYIYDLAAPRTPRLVGHARVPMTPCAISASGSLCAVGGSRLWLFDVSDPVNPTLVFDSAAQEVRDAAVRDTLVYVGWGGRLVVLNAAVPVRPRLLGDISIGAMGAMSSLDVSDTLLVCANLNTLTAFSVADPANPRRVGRWGLGSTVNAVVVREDTVYTSRVERFRIRALPSGIELEPVGRPGAVPFSVWPSVVQRQLNVAGCVRAVLVDVSGRKVADLRQGTNDMRHTAPGVYFVRGSGAGPARKVVVQR